MPGRWAVAKLSPQQPLPSWLESDAPFVSATWTADELSLIAPELQVPADVLAERGFAAFRIEGKIAFSTTGVLARLSVALADAGISVIALSTWDTDWFFVRLTDAQRAADAWRGAGHWVEDLADQADNSL
ncbi:MAG: ACT domain-containing protein [Gemmatimonadota bacterium]